MIATDRSPAPEPAGVRSDTRRGLVATSLVLGLLYFVQGVGEPTEGLIAQPMQSLLRQMGAGPARLSYFAALVAIPWALKPLYGLVIDFVPLGPRDRHRAWLIVACVLAALSTLALALVDFGPGDERLLLGMALVPTTAVAFADVAADSVMVARGQALNAIGILQSVQWSCLFGASILTGWLGGYLSASHAQWLGFVLCGALAFLASASAALGLPSAESGAAELGTPELNPKAALLRALGSRRVLGPGALLFLFAFNPFSSSVLYSYMMGPLQLGDQLYGSTVSVAAVASLLASAAYGFYSRKLTPRQRIHGSCFLGVLATLPYLWLHDESTALVVTASAAFAYATATLVQLELAAQACPTDAAGTVFALLMSLSNLGELLGTWSGGELWQALEPNLGAQAAYRWLVLIGAGTTLLAWLAAPWVFSSPAASRGTSPRQ